MSIKGPGKRAVRLLGVGVALALLAGGCSGGKKADAPSTPDTGTASQPAPHAAEGQPAVKKLDGDPANGKRIYEQYCHFCHGREGFGDGPVGIAITPHPADFVNDSKRMAKTDEELFISITRGIHRDIGGEEMAMPRWQDILSDQERWDVLSYIRRLSAEGMKKSK